MPDRILILSDTHFGRRKCGAVSAPALRPLWAECTHLIINGDAAEVHHPRHWTLAAREILHLIDLCDQDGVRITLLSGNHDPYLSDVRHLALADGAVFITHGDVLHPAVAPWSIRARRMRSRHTEALASVPPETHEHLETRLNAAQHAAHAEWDHMKQQALHASVLEMLLRPWTVPKVVWYWHRFPGMAAEFLNRHAPTARFGIFGHPHHPGLWMRDGRTIINTGSFGFPGTPWAVYLDNDHVLSVRKIQLHRDQYVSVGPPIAQFELAHAAAVKS